MRRKATQRNVMLHGRLSTFDWRFLFTNFRSGGERRKGAERQNYFLWWDHGFSLSLSLSLSRRPTSRRELEDRESQRHFAEQKTVCGLGKKLRCRDPLIWFVIGLLDKTNHQWPRMTCFDAVAPSSNYIQGTYNQGNLACSSKISFLKPCTGFHH